MRKKKIITKVNKNLNHNVAINRQIKIKKKMEVMIKIILKVKHQKVVIVAMRNKIKEILKKNN